MPCLCNCQTDRKQNGRGDNLNQQYGKKTASIQRTLRQPPTDRESLWERRNSSTQMNAILNPCNYEESEPDCVCQCDTIAKKAKSKIRWPVNHKISSRYHTKCVEKKPILKNPRKPKLNTLIPSQTCANLTAKPVCKVFKNECYCGEYKKSALGTDNNCIGVMERNNEQPISCATLNSDSTHSLKTIKQAQELLNYSPESKFLKRLRDKANKPCSCGFCKHVAEINAPLKYTARRHTLEKAYEKDQCKGKCNPYLSKCHTCCDKPYTNENYKIPPNTAESRFSSTKELDDPYDHNLLTSRSSPANHTHKCDKIKDIQHIRRNNYFECHSTDKLIDIPEHKCIYKFILDERLMPTAMTPDPYGVSRCDICNKPMCENSTNKQLDDIASSRRHCGNSKNECNWPEKMPGVSYKTIRINGKHDVVELHMPEEVLAEPKAVKFHRPESYHNSYALRYQKGII